MGDSLLGVFTELSVDDWVCSVLLDPAQLARRVREICL